jgi:hypothetical protein
MVQASILRARIVLRVNRIPSALRTAKMGDLYAKYHETAARNTQRSPQRIEKAPSPHKCRMEDIRERTRASPSPQKPKKRVRYVYKLRLFVWRAYNYSDEMAIDKENEQIENPKKKVRGGPAPPQRTASRSQVNPSQVLSPRSANSRTLPHSPIRPLPAKSGLARPVSPLKPTAPVPSGGAAGILTNMVEKAKATRGTATRKAAEPKPATTRATGRGRATPAPPPVKRATRGRGSTISDSSEGSNATVVKKPVVAKKEPVKRTVMGTLRGMGAAGKKAAAAKPATAPTAASTGGRVLRKRN